MKLYRRLVCVVVILSMLSSSAFAALDVPLVEASAYVVVERSTNTVLFESNSDQKLFPASITKLTTALVAIEHLKPEDILTVQKEDIEGLYKQGSSVFLKEGEQIPFSQLLKYLLIASGNDAANLIARTISGGTKEFAELMTKKAQELGCTGTHYTNPTGLHDENHYSTAHDIYLIGMEVSKNPTLMEICGTAKLILPATNKHGESTFFSTNYLLSPYKDNRYVYKGVNGIKTGWTGEAGMCLVSSANKNNLELLTVVLGAPKREDGSLGSFTETTKLLNFTFENFKKDIYIPATEPICEVKVSLASKDKSNLVLTLSHDYEDILPKDTNRSNISIVHLTDADIKAPIKKGDVLGNASITYDGKIRKNIDLIAANDVERSQFAYIMDVVGNFFTGTLFKIIIGVLIALLVIILATRYINIKNRRKRRGGRYRR